jgi:hypothetical protein
MKGKVMYNTLTLAQRDELEKIFRTVSLTEIRECLLERNVINENFPHMYHDAFDNTVSVVKSTLPKTMEDAKFNRVIGYIEAKIEYAKCVGDLVSKSHLEQVKNYICKTFETYSKYETFTNLDA